MDYKKLYDNLINKARNRKIEEHIGYEQHHIVPRCMNGSNDESNLVLLTLREHFIAHKLLVLIYPDNTKLKTAIWLIVITTMQAYKKYLKKEIKSKDPRVLNRINFFIENPKKVCIISSRDYNWAKLECIKAKKGKKYTEQERKNVSKGTKKGMQDPEKAKLRRKGVLHSKWYTNKITGEKRKWFPGMEPFGEDWYHGMPKIQEEIKEKIKKTLKEQQRRSIKNEEYGVSCIIDKRVLKLPEGWVPGFIFSRWKKNKQPYKLKEIFNTAFRDLNHKLVINGHFISDYYYLKAYSDSKGRNYTLSLYHFLLPEIKEYYLKDKELWIEKCYDKLINHLDELKKLNLEIYGVENTLEWI